MESYLYVGSKVAIQKDEENYQKILWRKGHVCLELQRGQVNLIIKRSKIIKEKRMGRIVVNNDTNKWRL